MMSPSLFAQRFVRLGRDQPFRFDGRPYLDAIYGAYRQGIVLRCSRQVEKSTFIANSILYELAMKPGVRLLFVAPRDQQSRLFAKLRILRAIGDSPFLRRHLIGRRAAKQKINDMVFANGSMLHIRSAFSTADSARGLSIDSLYVDEYQDMAHGHLPVLQEAMSHSPKPRTILAGTPKLIDNHLEEAYLNSTRNEWRIPCARCNTEHLPTRNLLQNAVFSCPACRQPLNPSAGRWEALNPSAEAAGFWINHFMVSWLNPSAIAQRRRDYDDIRFKNEVEGLPTVLGDHMVTLAELEACCTNFRMATSANAVDAEYRGQLVAGVDWSGGRNAQTAICIGYTNRSRIFQVVYFATFRPTEDPVTVLDQLGEICRRFDVLSIAADSGMGHVNNRLLYDRHRPEFAYTTISYADRTSEPTLEHPYHRWTVARTQSLGYLLSLVKSRHITFPHFSQSRVFLNEFASEVAHFDEEKRTIKFTCPENAHDDILHACNYALLQAGRIFLAGGGRQPIGFE